MKHRLFNLAPIISLLLCLVTTAMWVRSYSESDIVPFNRGPVWFVASIDGVLEIGGQPLPEGRWGRPVGGQDVVSTVKGVPPWLMFESQLHWLGFGFGFGANMPSTMYLGYVAAVPYWFVVLVLLVPSARWLYLKLPRSERIGWRGKLRGVRRRFFPGTAMLSFMIAVALTGLWLRSGGPADVYFFNDGPLWLIASTRGHIELVGSFEPADNWGRNTMSNSAGPGLSDGWPSPLDLTQGHYWYGFGYGVANPWAISNRFPDRILVVPHWFVVLIFLILPCYWLYYRKHHPPIPDPPMCEKCGYDLRASTGNCPECGAAIPAKVRVIHSPKPG